MLKLNIIYTKNLSFSTGGFAYGIAKKLLTLVPLANSTTWPVTLPHWVSTKISWDETKLQTQNKSKYLKFITPSKSVFLNVSAVHLSIIETPGFSQVLAI